MTIMQLSKEARLQAWSQPRLSSYRGLCHGEVSCALLLQKWKYQGATANQGITSPILGNLKPVRVVEHEGSFSIFSPCETAS